MGSRLIIFALLLAAGRVEATPQTQPARRPAPPAVAAAKPQPAVSAELGRRISQRRDPALRKTALDELTRMLDSPEAATQIDALRTLADVSEINFDHARFEPIIHRLISAPDAGVRLAALNVLPSYGTVADDLSTLVAMAGDSAPEVRAAVPKAYVAINGRIGDSQFDAMILKLLADADPRVQRGALNAVAHVPLGADVEARIIEMSRDETIRRDRPLNRDVMMYGLTTRPTISVPMARRLIDVLMDPPDEADFVQRATWAFRNSEVEPDAQPEVVDALVKTFKDSLNATIRDNCIAALGKIANDAALTALSSIATDPDEDDRVRQAAARAMNTP